MNKTKRNTSNKSFLSVAHNFCCPASHFTQTFPIPSHTPYSVFKQQQQQQLNPLNAIYGLQSTKSSTSI